MTRAISEIHIIAAPMDRRGEVCRICSDIVLSIANRPSSTPGFPRPLRQTEMIVNSEMVGVRLDEDLRATTLPSRPPTKNIYVCPVPSDSTTGLQHTNAVLKYLLAEGLLPYWQLEGGYLIGSRRWWVIALLSPWEQMVGYLRAQPIIRLYILAIRPMLSVYYRKLLRSPPDWCANRAALRSADAAGL
jgi:hypothetical protein